MKEIVDFFLETVSSALFLVLDRVVPLVSSLVGEGGASILLGALFGIVLVPIYGKVSPQGGIAAVKRRISGALLESVLFRADPWLSLRAQARLFFGGLVYFALAIPPILILLVPCVIVLAHLNPYFGYEFAGKSSVPVVSQSALSASQSLSQSPSQTLLHSEQVMTEQVMAEQVMTVVLAQPKSVNQSGGIRLVASPHSASPYLGAEGLSPEIVGPARIIDGSGQVGEISARVSPQLSSVELQGLSHAVRIPLSLGSAGDPYLRQHAFVGGGWLNWLLYPSDLSLSPDIASVSIGVSEREVSVFGISTHWILFFVGASLIAGYAASKVFGVEV